MQKLLWYVGAVFFLVYSPSTPAVERDALILAGEVLTHPGETPKRMLTLVVRDGRLAAVLEGFASRAEAGVSPESAIYDLRDEFVMPGLIDAHVHLTINPGKAQLSTTTDADLAVTAAINARRTLMAGFTTVRDLGSWDAEAIFAVRDAVAAGELQGPTIIAAGESIGATGGHGDRRLLRVDVTSLFVSDGVCDGPADCRRAVRAQYRKGADVIKVHATGGGADPNGKRFSAPEMFPDELSAIVQTAHSLGLKVAAHAHGIAGVKAALRAGVDSVEHASWLDAEAISLFTDSETVMVRTAHLQDYFLSRINIPETAQARRRARNVIMDAEFRDVIEAGIPLVVGSDAGIMPHGENAKEIVKLTDLGLSPAAALVAATSTAASLLGLGDEVGRLEPGLRADIIALDGNPLDDIQSVERVVFVMKNGVATKNEASAGE